MKTLEEKKLLVKMAKMLGQPIDQALVESIEREEKLMAAFFGEKKEPIVEEKIPILKEDLLTEADPRPAPEPAFVPPIPDSVQQTVNLLNTVATANPQSPMPTASSQKDVDNLKRQIAEIMQKLSTLSWGGGGTGVVRIWDTDDFDRKTASNGRYMRWDNGVFSLDDINPHDVVYNTTEVNVPYYELDDNDYYLGVTYAGPTIELPATASSGRMIVIKDETGNCSNNPIVVTGTVDNDAGGFILKIDNGGIQLLYRNGWRII